MGSIPSFQSLTYQVQYQKHYGSTVKIDALKGWQQAQVGEKIVNNVKSFKSFNTRELIDAIAQNGYKKAVGALVRNRKRRLDDGRYAEREYTSPEDIGSACALGQGFLNLGIEPDQMYYYQRDLPTELTHLIFKENDRRYTPVSEIGEKLKTSKWYTNPVKFKASSNY